MKETKTINLNGYAFYIDIDAFRLLKDYIDDIKLRQPIEQQQEVIDEIERKICNFFQEQLFARNRQVIDIQMVNDAIGTVMSKWIGADNPKESELDSEAPKRKPRIERNGQTSRSGCGRIIGISLLVLLFFSALPVLLPLITAFFILGFGAFSLGMPMAIDWSEWQTSLLIISFLAALVIPIVAIIYLIITYVRKKHAPKLRFWIIAVIAWVISLGCFTFCLVEEAKEFGGIEQFLEQLDKDETALVQQPKTVTTFNAINIDGAVTADIKQGDVPAIAVNDSFLVNYQIIDSVLAISGSNINGPKLVSVTVTDIEALNISGASKVDLQGQYHQLHVTLNGASKLDAEEAQVDILHVNCLGASKAHVSVQNELWAQASGASKITYKGKPQLKRSMAVGGSRITKQ